MESGFGISMPLERFDKTQSKRTKRLGLKVCMHIINENCNFLLKNQFLISGS